MPKRFFLLKIPYYLSRHRLLLQERTPAGDLLPPCASIPASKSLKRLE